MPEESSVLSKIKEKLIEKVIDKFIDLIVPFLVGAGCLGSIGLFSHEFFFLNFAIPILVIILITGGLLFLVFDSFVKGTKKEKRSQIQEQEFLQIPQDSFNKMINDIDSISSKPQFVEPTKQELIEMRIFLYKKQFLPELLPSQNSDEQKKLESEKDINPET